MKTIKNLIQWQNKGCLLWHDYSWSPDAEGEFDEEVNPIMYLKLLKEEFNYIKNSKTTNYRRIERTIITKIEEEIIE